MIRRGFGVHGHNMAAQWPLAQNCRRPPYPRALCPRTATAARSLSTPDVSDTRLPGTWVPNHLNQGQGAQKEGMIHLLHLRGALSCPGIWSKSVMHMQFGRRVLCFFWVGWKSWPHCHVQSLVTAIDQANGCNQGKGLWPKRLGDTWSIWSDTFTNFLVCPVPSQQCSPPKGAASRSFHLGTLSNRGCISRSVQWIKGKPISQKNILKSH
jgi:hypothetical protein